MSREEIYDNEELENAEEESTSTLETPEAEATGAELPPTLAVDRNGSLTEFF